MSEKIINKMAGPVSSGSKKSGPPAHANKFAYVHNRSSKKTKKILAYPISGFCKPCREVIEWRKRFRKYKPLTVPKKCVRCSEKNIREAYHVICNPCSCKHSICTKCLQPFSAEKEADNEDGASGNDEEREDQKEQKEQDEREEEKVIEDLKSISIEHNSSSSESESVLSSDNED